jgi:hypothetical protein
VNLSWACVRNVGTCALMPREQFKWKAHKNLSTDAGHRDGPERSSDEIPVMGMERRIPGHPAFEAGQPEMGGAIGEGKTV